jgi:pimeloyl-ACP methyl ester carboxylesterase
MRRPWIRKTALLAAAAFALFAFGWVPYFLGGLATTRRFNYNDRENKGLTPASFQLPFEDVTFRAADGVALSGWWVPAREPRGTVVLVHGLNRSRIEMVKKTPFLHARGWNALLFDLRHHGASGGDTSSFGHFEKQDVHAAAEWARRKMIGSPSREVETGGRIWSSGPVVLWGVSLGGASAALAAAEDPTVAALVCDSSYRSLRDTVDHHVTLARTWRWWMRLVPRWPVGAEVLYWIGRRGGFDVDAVDVRAAAGRLSGRPALFVCNSGDTRMPAEIAFDLKAAAGNRARVLVVPGNSHGGAWRDGTAAYERAVGEILDEAGARHGARVASNP